MFIFCGSKKPLDSARDKLPKEKDSLSVGIFASQNQSPFPKLAPRLHEFFTETAPYAYDRGYSYAVWMMLLIV
ncbi:MAG: hypothetical protein R2802_10280 [Flavobacteriaceae bacterium]